MGFGEEEKVEEENANARIEVWKKGANKRPQISIVYSPHSTYNTIINRNNNECVYTAHVQIYNNRWKKIQTGKKNNRNSYENEIEWNFIFIFGSKIRISCIIQCVFWWFSTRQ